MLAVLVGRTIKYWGIALLLIVFDINLIEVGQNILRLIFGG
jgi:hypothetical protein